MINWFKRTQKETTPTDIKTDTPPKKPLFDELPDIETKEETLKVSKTTIFSRLKQRLSKTRQHFGQSIGQLLLGKKSLDQTLFDELEISLLQADLGIEVTKTILDDLSQKVARKSLADGDAVFAVLKTHLQTMLAKNTKPMLTPIKGPQVILMVGVNGAGKTTTIGKLACQYQQQGKRVMLAAGDTFRAAAVEQLKVWGARNQIPVIAQHAGADSASVLFDALQAASARNMDILIADTAGRLHTQTNLMEELKKIKRVLQKMDSSAPHEVMLVLDASIGQNALFQAREFHEAVGVTGITMTKLDGTAKGGILFAIANELAIPFRYIGIGENIEDLRIFEPQQFVEAIFND
ncbi:MAG: signal recognition particle-docking protein FtsY [Legionellaceae bacterium]|nr:signal recognition particle-docking protein FtsY [Legionellaceae bacterium]HCA90272.1 signal recognition particle-docking protein FtsY [Legionellales bacterium]|tara:strand:- start:72 stop:1121 length:1050 start_codon:yes stop_codon:yes gene_type:complete